MKLGCGKYDTDTFLKNVEELDEDFRTHMEECEDCKESFTEIRIGIKKMETFEFEGMSKEVKYGRILLNVRDGVLEIVDALSGTRYGARLAFRGDEVYQTKREVVYESGNMKIFIDSYDAKELVLSVRVNGYGEINIYDGKGDVIRSTSGKSGVDIRISEGTYIVRYNDEEISIQVSMGG